MLWTPIWAGDFDNLSFGKEETLDIITWNIEHFPKSGTTVEQVKEIILALNADIIAIQEVDDTAKFTKMVAELEGYDGCYGNFYYVALGYIYKSSLQVNKIEELFFGQWSVFPRPPYLLEVSYAGERYSIINNHFKCCGDGTLDTTNENDEEYRRLRASDGLKNYIDTHLDSSKVIVLGDLNDVLEDQANNNVFQSFLDDSDNYKFSNWGIVQGSSSDWSYPSWPSHLDHILITNELFEQTDDAQVIKLDDYMGSWNAYDSSISDHRPVGIHITQTCCSGLYNKKVGCQNLLLIPNPCASETSITFAPLAQDGILRIYDVRGKLHYSKALESGIRSHQIDVNNLSNGMYYTSLTTSQGNLSSPFIVQK